MLCKTFLGIKLFLSKENYVLYGNTIFVSKIILTGILTIKF
jgi:hypothetical protein